MLKLSQILGKDEEMSLGWLAKGVKLIKEFAFTSENRFELEKSDSFLHIPYNGETLSCSNLCKYIQHGEYDSRITTK